MKARMNQVARMVEYVDIASSAWISELSLGRSIRETTAKKYASGGYAVERSSLEGAKAGALHRRIATSSSSTRLGLWHSAVAFAS